MRKKAFFQLPAVRKQSSLCISVTAFNIPVVTLTNVKEYAADMQEEKTISQAVADLT